MFCDVRILLFFSFLEFSVIYWIRNNFPIFCYVNKIPKQARKKNNTIGKQRQISEEPWADRDILPFLSLSAALIPILYLYYTLDILFLMTNGISFTLRRLLLDRHRRQNSMVRRKDPVGHNFYYTFSLIKICYVIPILILLTLKVHRLLGTQENIITSQKTRHGPQNPIFSLPIRRLCSFNKIREEIYMTRYVSISIYSSSLQLQSTIGFLLPTFHLLFMVQEILCYGYNILTKLDIYFHIPDNVNYPLITMNHQ